MDGVFDRMRNLLDDSSESTDLDEELAIQASTDEILLMTIPEIKFDIRYPMIEIVEFDRSNNILNAEIREEFKQEVIFEETDIFTSPVSTTNTMEGFISNVRFHERDLIEELMVSEDIVICRCNYGIIKYPGYTEPAKIRKTNRGRKKKPKNKKIRKKQGSGEDFNSQVTFIVRSGINKEQDGEPTGPEGIIEIPYGTKVYKFKIFRTGKLQLPGVHQHLIEDVIEGARKIVEVLNFHLHPGELNPALRADIINMNPVMKNYKLVVKMPVDHIIDMQVLMQILAQLRMAQFAGNDDSDDESALCVKTPEGMPDHPPIFLLKFTRQDTKLSIKFTTPIFHKPKKKTRINIFMRGKINILGAFDAPTTRQICDFLHWIFKAYTGLVVPEGIICRAVPVVPIADIVCEPVNVTPVDILQLWSIPMPYITNSEYESVMGTIESVYVQKIEEANNYVNILVADLIAEFNAAISPNAVDQ